MKLSPKKNEMPRLPFQPKMRPPNTAPRLATKLQLENINNYKKIEYPTSAFLVKFRNGLKPRVMANLIPPLPLTFPEGIKNEKEWRRRGLLPEVKVKDQPFGL